MHEYRNSIFLEFIHISVPPTNVYIPLQDSTQLVAGQLQGDTSYKKNDGSHKIKNEIISVSGYDQDCYVHNIKLKTTA